MQDLLPNWLNKLSLPHRYYTLLAWLPSFFELALGLNVQSSSLLTLIPYIAMVLMTPFVGPVADGLVKKGWRLTNVRKLAQVSIISCPALDYTWRRTGNSSCLHGESLLLRRLSISARW